MMTTVDVRIENVLTQERLYLHNGLWGPATRVLHGLGQACRDGRIATDTWNVAEITALASGAIVRETLESITDSDWQESRDRTDRERVADFLEHLEDDADYKVRALEV